jgi:hypothetical protein
LTIKNSDTTKKVRDALNRAIALASSVAEANLIRRELEGLASV